ncbi:RibD family protein [Xanthobacter sp. 126]|uniref:RibD family protein n=1 Tax=Xanthobacter sp. 126 TaxID=1131814 RepID=UPI00045E84C6|nr:RibD family protein [Xanthobacter sp. 126]
MDDTTLRLRSHKRVSGYPVQDQEAAANPRPHVIAQLGQSLDGRIATTSGESKYINGPHALDHLHALRASVDAVVVGVGTVCADDPLLTVRRIAGVSPARVVIDPSGRVDPNARCFAEDGVRRLVVRGRSVCAPLPAGVDLVEMDDRPAFDPSAILESLAQQGFRRILVEGGPTTLSAFLEADLVDQLHVFVSPVILGAGRIGLSRNACDTLAHALRPKAQVHVFADGDVLFRCDLRESARGAGSRDAPSPVEANPPDEQHVSSRALRAAS